MLVYAPSPPLPVGPLQRRTDDRERAVGHARPTDRDGDPGHPGRPPGERQPEEEEERTGDVAAPAQAPNPISSETGAALLAILAAEGD